AIRNQESTLRVAWLRPSLALHRLALSPYPQRLWNPRQGTREGSSRSRNGGLQLPSLATFSLRSAETRVITIVRSRLTPVLRSGRGSCPGIGSGCMWCLTLWKREHSGQRTTFSNQGGGRGVRIGLGKGRSKEV